MRGIRLEYKLLELADTFLEWLFDRIPDKWILANVSDKVADQYRRVEELTKASCRGIN
jgi:hypothetical protein